MALKREKWDPLFRKSPVRTRETIDRQLKEDMDYWRDTPWWQNPNVYRGGSRSFAESKTPMSRRPSFRGLLGETMPGEYGGLPLAKEPFPQFRMSNVPELELPTPFQNFAREEDILASQAQQRGGDENKKTVIDWLKKNRPDDPRIKEARQAEMVKEMETWKPFPLSIRREEGVSFQPKFADTPTERAYQESLPSAANLEQMNLEKGMMDKTMASDPIKADEDRSLLSEAGEGVQSEARQFARTFNPQSTEDVTKLQGYLTELGYDIGGVDGVLGPKTEKALRALQGVKYSPPTKSAKGKKGSTQQIKKVEDIKKQAKTITQGRESMDREYDWHFSDLIRPTKKYGRIPDDLFGVPGLGTKAFWSQTRPKDSSSYRGR